MFPHSLGDCLAWMSETARIRRWIVPGGGWPGSTRATRGITTSTSMAGSCATCQPAARPPWMSAAGRACSPGSWPRTSRASPGSTPMRAWPPPRARAWPVIPRVTIRHCDFEQFAAAAGHGEADLITMVAVLHHLCLDDTLARIPGLLAPGGRLLVVGLARVNSLSDLAVDLVSAAANPVMGLIKHPGPARPAEGPAAGQPVMPVRDPAATLAEITAAARAHLPGATVRRRLFFRYTLRWDKPPVTAPPPGSGNPAAPVTTRRLTGQRHERRTPRWARAGADSPRRLRAADHRACPLLIGARRAHRRRSACLRLDSRDVPARAYSAVLRGQTGGRIRRCVGEYSAGRMRSLRCWAHTLFVS